MRSGAQALMLLAAPPNVLILGALAEAPSQQQKLLREAEYPAQSTLRTQLKRLCKVGAIEKHRRNRFPGILEYELTACGRELLEVADALERWLAEFPDHPLALSGNPARAAVKALVAAWSSTMLRGLAARPLTLTALDELIGSISYPSLERRLTAMRLAGLVAAQRGGGRGTPHAVTAWARRSVLPLAAAARWERRHGGIAAPPFTALDLETMLLLLVPLLRPDPQLSGTLQMGAEIQNGDRKLAGVTVSFENGLIRSCTTHMRSRADAWALGSLGSWLNALLEAGVDELELGGDSGLIRSVVEQLPTLPASNGGAARLAP